MATMAQAKLSPMKLAVARVPAKNIDAVRFGMKKMLNSRVRSP
jgi:hypothetical protein